MSGQADNAPAFQLPTSALQFFNSHTQQYHQSSDPCPICREPYSLPTLTQGVQYDGSATHGVLVVNVPGCVGHHFHQSCLLEHLDGEFEHSNKCPCCRIVWYSFEEFEGLDADVLENGDDNAIAERVIELLASPEYQDVLDNVLALRNQNQNQDQNENQ